MGEVLRADELHEAASEFRTNLMGFLNALAHAAREGKVRSDADGDAHRFLGRLGTHYVEVREKANVRSDHLFEFVEGLFRAHVWPQMCSAINGSEARWDNWAPVLRLNDISTQEQLLVLMNSLHDEGLVDTESYIFPDTRKRCPPWITGYGSPRPMPAIGLTAEQVEWLASSIQGDPYLQRKYVRLACEAVRAWVRESYVRQSILAVMARFAPRASAEYSTPVLLEAFYRIIRVA